MGIIVKSVERLSTLLAQVSMWAVFLMMMLEVTDVLLRTFASSSLLVTDELCGYLLVVVAFLTYAEALKRDGHVRVDMVFNTLSKRVRTRLELIFCVVSLIATFVVTWASVVMVYRAYVRGVTIPGILLTPVYLPQMAVVIGLMALLLQLLVEIRKLARKA